MDNLSVAFFPLCLFLLLEIPDRSRMCYRVWVIGKKGASSQSYSQKHEKEGQLWGVTWVVGAGGCAGVMTTFENPQFRSLFYIWHAVPQNQKKTKLGGGY